MTISDGDIANLLNEELYARRVKALFLHNAGATIAKIADECGVSTGTVRKDLEIAKRQYLSETPEQRRAVQMAVIMDMRKANYPAMMRGDTDAANVILRGLKQEAQLFALFPKVLEVPGINDVEFANEAAALIERIAELDPHGLKELTHAHHRPTPESVDADVVEAADVPDECGTGATPFDAARPGGQPRPADADEPDAGGRSSVDGADHGPDPADDEDGWSNIGG